MVEGGSVNHVLQKELISLQKVKSVGYMEK